MQVLLVYSNFQHDALRDVTCDRMSENCLIHHFESTSEPYVSS